jgi:hypothetical protein
MDRGFQIQEKVFGQTRQLPHVRIESISFQRADISAVRQRNAPNHLETQDGKE